VVQPNDVVAPGLGLATRREWIGLAVLALPCLLYSMDLEVLYLAVPAISADLDPTAAQMLWIVDIYGFMLAGSLITMGTLGDRIGRRRLLLWGAAAFGAASVLAAFAQTAEMLILARALLGVAGATLAPSTLSLIRNMFLDPRQRTFAVSVWVTCFSVGAAVGPLVGGVLLQFFWWGSVFLVAVPIMVVILAIGPTLLPEFRNPDAGRLDVLSAVLSLVAVLAGIYGLKHWATEGMDTFAVGSILLSLVMGTVFVRRQHRLADPLVDLELFRVPAFSASLAVNAAGIFVAAGVFLFITQYLQLVVGLTPLEAGLLTIPSAGALIVGSMLTPLLARWCRPAYAMAAGLTVAAIGAAMLVFVNAAGSVPLLVAASVVLYLGIAPVVTLATDVIVSAAPPARAGSASALSETSIELGGALGIAVLGSIGIGVYRNQLNDSMPTGVPTQAATDAVDTLGGAVAAADDLPGGVGDQLLDAAQAAFANGLVVVSLASAVLMAILAVLAVTVLRIAGIREPAEEPRSTTA
jgi:DHA2 family multidrug resistance protein-like MFS transporter